MLAPRLALLMKGTAWAQVKSLDGSKLSDPEGGVKLLLSAHGKNPRNPTSRSLP